MLPDEVRLWSRTQLQTYEFSTSRCNQEATLVFRRKCQRISSSVRARRMRVPIRNSTEEFTMRYPFSGAKAVAMIVNCGMESSGTICIPCLDAHESKLTHRVPHYLFCEVVNIEQTPLPPIRPALPFPWNRIGLPVLPPISGCSTGVDSLSFAHLKQRRRRLCRSVHRRRPVPHDGSVVSRLNFRSRLPAVFFQTLARLPMRNECLVLQGRISPNQHVSPRVAGCRLRYRHCRYVPRQPARAPDSPIRCRQSWPAVPWRWDATHICRSRTERRTCSRSSHERNRVSPELR